MPENVSSGQKSFCFAVVPVFSIRVLEERCVLSQIYGQNIKHDLTCFSVT